MANTPRGDGGAQAGLSRPPAELASPTTSPTMVRGSSSQAPHCLRGLGRMHTPGTERGGGVEQAELARPAPRKPGPSSVSPGIKPCFPAGQPALCLSEAGTQLPPRPWARAPWCSFSCARPQNWHQTKGSGSAVHGPPATRAQASLSLSSRGGGTSLCARLGGLRQRAGGLLGHGQEWAAEEWATRAHGAQPASPVVVVAFQVEPPGPGQLLHSAGHH